jgi:MFS family permease
MDTFKWSSSGAGLIFATTAIPSFAGVYVGKLISRFGARIPGTIAFVIATISWIAMRFVNSNTATDVTLLVALLLLQGVSIVFVEITAMTEVSQVVGDYEIEFPGAFGDKSPVAQAYALFNMAFAGGQLLGPILAGGIRVWAGWNTMTLIIGLVCGLTAIPMGLFSGAPLRDGDYTWEDEV